MRTYLWGAMLAQVNDIKFDEELFFTASVLHDLGLTSTHLCQDASCSCFAVEGARAARRFVSTHAWSNQRSDQLAEAISLHLNVRVGLGRALRHICFTQAQRWASSACCALLPEELISTGPC